MTMEGWPSQRPGHRHPLVLASELVGPVMEPVAEPHLFEEGDRPIPRLLLVHPGDEQRHHHVLDGVELR